MSYFADLRKNRRRLMRRKNDPELLGIKTETGMEISPPPDLRNAAALFVMRLVIAFVGAASAVCCFLTAAPFSEYAGSAVMTAAAVCPVMTAVTSVRGKKAAYISAGVTALMIAAAAYFIVKNIGTLTDGFMLAANKYMAAVNYDYLHKDLFSVEMPDDPERCIRAFFCAVTAAISAGLCLSMLPAPNLLAVFTLTFPCAEAVLYFGLAPDQAAFGGLIAVWAAAAASEMSGFPFSRKIRDFRTKKAVVQSGICAFAAMLAGFAGVCIWGKLTDYERSERIDDMRKSVSDYVMNTSPEEFIDDAAEFLRLKKTVIGSIDDGKLGRQDEIKFKHNSVLEVSLPKQEQSVYLRGFVGVNYTGSSWEQLNPLQKTCYDNIAADFADGYFPQMTDNIYYMALSDDEKYIYTIKNIAAQKKYAYMPYRNLKRSSFVMPERDGAFLSDGSRTYSGTAALYSVDNVTQLRVYPKYFYAPGDGENSLVSLKNTWYDSEAAYRSFVYDTYLDLPSDFIIGDVVFDGIDKTYRNSELTLDPVTYCSEVIRQYLNDNTEYDLAAGKTPAGKDFAEYFLLENKKGSCTHYATTAVLLARYCGIPARYIEGYIITPDNFSPAASLGQTDSVSVLDDNAHAWAEFYIDGYGWYPMEFTKGYIPNEEIDVETGSSGPEAETETVTVTVTTAAETETEISGSETSVSETDPEEYPQSGGGISSGNGNSAKKPIDMKAISRLAAAAAVIVIIIMRPFIVMHFRKKRFAVMKKNIGIKAVYAYFIKLLGDMGAEYDRKQPAESEAERLDGGYPQLSGKTAQLIIGKRLKAEYSEHGITEEELSECADAAIKLAESLYAEKKLLAKVIYRFVLCRI